MSMTQAPRLHRRAALLLPLAGTALLAARPARAEATLDSVMRGLAAIPASRADFTETKSLAELTTDLPSSGTLSWTAPDRVEKHTLEPVEEILRIQGDRLVFERPGMGLRRELSLDQSPELRPLVESIRATLAGDLATLRRHYEVTFRPGTGESWTMRLVPLGARVRMALQEVTVAGRGAAVLAVESIGNEGTTRMRITPRP
jgi:hypothetical protein